MRPASVPGDIELVAMKVNGMVIHPEIHQADANPVAELASIGVVAGPDLPFIVSQLNSMASELGIVLFGKIAHSCRTIPKSRSTRGAWARVGE